MSARAVAELKSAYKHIRLIMLLPYNPIERAVEKPDCVDELLYPFAMESVPRKFAIIRANHYVIDRADFLIAFSWKPGSNSRKFLEYAEKRRKRGKPEIIKIKSEFDQY